MTDQHPTVAYRAARILEPSDGSIRADACLVVQGERIAGISNEPPPGVVVVDVGDATLLPGLIDCHTHMCLRPEDQVWPPAITFKTQPYRAIESAAAARTAIDIGFTTARDTDNEGVWHGDTALRDAINRGIVPGPRMLVASDAISITAGDMTLVPGVNVELQLPDVAAMADSRDAMIREVRRQVKIGADWIKIYTTSTRRDVDRKTFEPLHQFTVDDVTAMVAEARRYRRDVAAHAYGGAGAIAAIEGGARSLEHGPLLDPSVLTLMVEYGTFWVPTLSTYEKRQFNDFDREFVRRHRTAFQQALELGVRIAYGTDVGSFPHGEQIDEFSLMVAYGMSPLDAVRSATSTAAELLRMEGEVGTLRPGASADFIAVDGVPEEDIDALRRVRLVVKQGRVHRESDIAIDARLAARVA